MKRPPTLHEQMHQRLVDRAGLGYEYGRLKGKSLEEIRRSFAAKDFDDSADRKFTVGAFRYGLITEQRKNGKSYNHIDSIRERLDYYEKTGNMDVLPDIANLAKAEWIVPHNSEAHLNDDWDAHGYHAPGRMS